MNGSAASKIALMELLVANDYLSKSDALKLLTMEGSFDWFSQYDEPEPEREWAHSTPPVKVGAIVNRKGQFQKYRVMDTTSGWRSIKIAPINDKTATEIVSWDQFVIGWEERFF